MQCGKEGHVYCHSCMGLLDSAPALPNIRIYTDYLSAKEIIWQYKYQSKRALARDIAEALNTRFKISADICTYIPTISSHIRQRGFDHAKLLAKEFSRQSKLPLSGLLKRKWQYTQVGAGRKTNVSGKNILIIEDVISSGATITAASELLMNNGAKSVETLVFAQSRL